jgi:hypothetical protein
LGWRAGARLHSRSHTVKRLRCSSLSPNSFTTSALAAFASGASMVPRLWARERKIETCQRLAAASFCFGDFIPLKIAWLEPITSQHFHHLATELSHLGRRQLIRLTPSVWSPGHLPRLAGVFFYARASSLQVRLLLAYGGRYAFPWRSGSVPLIAVAGHTRDVTRSPSAPRGVGGGYCPTAYLGFGRIYFNIAATNVQEPLSLFRECAARRAPQRPRRSASAPAAPECQFVPRWTAGRPRSPRDSGAPAA